MAYALRYYKELTHPDGTVYRLEIHEKDGTAPAMEIGKVVQGLRLDVQGDTEIDAPIVKTSLTMTFVDAPDHAEAKTKKCGNWEEFYTSDATKWQVVMKYRKSGGASFVTMWGGYITPDSYTETLVYRGSVTIIARDNIGHMQDFPFDAEGNADGMISFLDLVYEAWDKIESPMSLVLRDSGDAMWMYTDGVAAYDTMMNVSAFKEKNWLEALEDALYAYGVVMRYVGDNNVSIMPLRSLPMMGEASFDDVPTAEPVFMTGAERELTPAVRRIEETVEYKIESAIQPQVKHEDFTLNRDYYAYDYGSASGKIETGIVEAISNTDKTKGWANEADKTLFFDPNAYELSEYAKVQPYAETLKKSMYIAVNNVKNASLDNIDRFVTYGKTMRCQDFAYVFNLGMLIQWSGSGKISKVEGYSLSGMTYAVSMERLGITYYYAGEGRWQTSYKELNLELAGGDANNSVEIPIGIGQYGSPDPANFVIYIKRISYTRQGDEASGRGLYVAIQSLEIASPQTSPIFAKNNVNTAYDSTNNVILSRDPKIAPALNTVSLPALIQNGIFIKRGEIYDSAKSWAWDGQTPQQMAVYNHLQLLCYHAKPNNILRGTIVNADVADMQVIWMWHGAEHMLVSGTLDLISGYIENAVLREFARYEDMWGLLDPADLPDVDGSSVTNAESGSASKSEGARNTINTEVYLGGGNIVLDTYMSDSSENGVQNKVIKAYVDGEVKEVADLLTSMWRIEDNKIVTDMDVLIKANLIVEGDTSSGGEGEDTPASGIRGIYVNGTPYTDEDGDGFIDLGTISGGVSGDYLPLTGGRIKGNSLDIGREDNYAGAFVKIITNASTSADYGTSIRHYEKSSGSYTYKGLLIDKNGVYYSNNGSNYNLIHSGNIGSNNAGSATKLATARTIWGQSFDGTGDVSGSLSIGTSSIFMSYNGNDMSIVSPSAGKPIFGYGTAAKGYDTYVDGYKIHLRYGVSHTEGLFLNESGNVGIGTTSPSSKLSVHSNAASALPSLGALATEYTIEFGHAGKYGTYLGTLGSGNGFIQQGRSDGTATAYNLLLQPLAGNVGIGTSSPAYKLDVAGTGRFTGAVTMSSTLSVSGNITCSSNLIVTGDTSSGSDIRFKDIIKDKTIKIEHIAKAPLFTFKWNDRDDDTIHLGSSAQYWEKVCPWLVTGEDFKSLNYATLGVAMGISLAKKAVNHEERIKELEREIKRLKEEMRYGDR